MYAIFYLCVLDKSYVKGVMISAFSAKKYKPKNVELVCMCDAKLFKYKKLLMLVFDRVIKIKLSKVNSYHPKEKYHWIGYSLNKHQIYNGLPTNFGKQYEKILFLDADILVFSKKFFNIFKCPTPSFYIRDIAGVKIDAANFKSFKKYSSPVNYQNGYNQEIYKFNYFIDAGIMLVEPSKKFYKDYMKFISNIDGDIQNTKQSGIDETTMIYYITKNKMKFHLLKPQFNISSWRDNIKNFYSKNYISKINPWEKDLKDMWDEEKIWHILKLALYKKYQAAKQLEKI